MVTIRPITFTPAPLPTQTRYPPSGATIRPIVSPTPSPAPDYEHPGGLTRPDGSGTLSPETIEARSQQVVNTRSAPYSHYVVQGSSWYGVRTVDGMTETTRLNPATQETYPDPNYRYQTAGRGRPTFTEGSAGNIQIGASARPQAPGPGSSKAAITAYGEALASWERAEMWRSVDPAMSYGDLASAWDTIRFDVPTTERRAYEIRQAALPSGPSARFAEIERQYAAQRGTILSSSGILKPTGIETYSYVDDSGLYLRQGTRVTGWQNVTRGEAFVPTEMQAASPGGAISAPSLPSPQQIPGAGFVGLIGSIARAKLGQDYITGNNMLTSALQQKKAPSLAGPLFPPETMRAVRSTALTLPRISTLWSAGEYIGLDYLLGVKTEEYNKQYSVMESRGLITGTEFRGTETEYKALDSQYKQIQTIASMRDIALNRTLNVNVAGVQAEGKSSAWIYEGGKGITSGIKEFGGGIIGGVGKAVPSQALTLGVGTVAMGMMMAGVSPQVLPHTVSFVKGFGQGVAAVPEFIGMGIAGGEILLRHPQMVPGAAILGGYIQAKGVYEGVTTRPVEFIGEMYGTALALGAMGRVGYAASPVKYTSAAFEARGRPTATYRGLYAESPVRGVRNLVLGGVEGLGTRQLGGITSYEGRPWYRPTVSGGTPSHLVDYLGEGYPDYPALGVKIALTQERLTREGNRPDLISFRQELQTMDQLFRIRPSTIKNPLQEIQNIHGMTEGAGRDFLTTLRDQFPTHRVGGSLGQAVQSRFSRAAADIDLYLLEEQIPAGRTFVTEWNRRHGTNIKVDIHEYPQPGSFIGRYGIRTEKDITVEGINIMPVREQALRKLSQPMMLRNVEGAWRILPEAHRGKDIADTIGALQSEMYRLQESPGSFLYRGRMRGLQESIDVQMGKMQPGALPTERIGRRIYDPSEAAAARYRQYRWDYTESPYVKVPFTRTYFDVTPYDIFNRPIPIYQELGIGPQTPWGIVMEVTPKQFEATVPRGTPTTKISGQILKTIDIPETAYPAAFKPAKGSSIKSLFTYPGVSGVPLASGSLVFTGKYPAPGTQALRMMASIFGGYPTPGQKIPEGVTPLFKLYQGVTKIPPPHYLGVTIPIESPYPKITTRKTSYPPTTKANEIPYAGVTQIPAHKYPPPTIPQETPYPEVWLAGSKITPTTKIRTTEISTTSRGQRVVTTSGEQVRLYLPKTTPLAIPTFRKIVLTEETPHKKRPLKLHYDVLASKWNIESPVPRIPQAFGWGKLARQAGRNELKIFNLQKSRTPLVYMKHRPFEQFEGIKVPKVI